MGHRLQNHNGKCVNLHGHQYILEVVVEGEINKDTGSSSRGMVVDFGDIKTILDRYVHEVCDHAFMVSENDELMAKFYKENPQLKHVIVPFDSTAENIANWIFERLSPEIAKLSGNVRLVSVQLWETQYNWAKLNSY